MQRGPIGRLARTSASNRATRAPAPKRTPPPARTRSLAPRKGGRQAVWPVARLCVPAIREVMSQSERLPRPAPARIRRPRLRARSQSRYRVTLTTTAPAETVDSGSAVRATSAKSAVLETASTTQSGWPASAMADLVILSTGWPALTASPCFT